jgi:hypothetical protein
VIVLKTLNTQNLSSKLFVCLAVYFGYVVLVAAVEAYDTAVSFDDFPFCVVRIYTICLGMHQYCTIDAALIAPRLLIHFQIRRGTPITSKIRSQV